MLFTILAIIIYLMIGILISMFSIPDIVEISVGEPFFAGITALVFIIVWPGFIFGILLAFIIKALGSLIININERIEKRRERKKESEE